MIYVGNIVSELNSRLDAQGSDYYSFNQNYVQAINASIRFVISLIDKVAEENKLATELLSELQRVAVVTLSKYSRFTYDQSKMWSIRSINPLRVVMAYPPFPFITRCRTAGGDYP